MNQPLSMIFAGPSGNGKTELAKELAELLNLHGDNAFHKVDCGKMASAAELFGMAGYWQGAKEGSSLNNFQFCLEHFTRARQDWSGAAR
jgi:ATP-dependent Clp protease ATP-binding subunit ClpB